MASVSGTQGGRRPSDWRTRGARALVALTGSLVTLLAISLLWFILDQVGL